MEIKTPEDWWRTVDDNWHYLLPIMQQFLLPTAVKDAQIGKEKRDWQYLHTRFEMAWAAAPYENFLFNAALLLPPLLPLLPQADTNMQRTIIKILVFIIRSFQFLPHHIFVQQH